MRNPKRTSEWENMDQNHPISTCIVTLFSLNDCVIYYYGWEEKKDFFIKKIAQVIKNISEIVR